MDWTTVTAGLASGAFALGGVGLASRLQTTREQQGHNRQMKVEAYGRWLQFSENAGTWAFTGQSWADWQETLHNRQIEVDFVASQAVRDAVARYIDDGMPAAMEAIAHVAPPGRGRPDEDVASEAGVAYSSAVRSYREAVLRSMRSDLGLD